MSKRYYSIKKLFKNEKNIHKKMKALNKQNKMFLKLAKYVRSRCDLNKTKNTNKVSYNYLRINVISRFPSNFYSDYSISSLIDL